MRFLRKFIPETLFARFVLIIIIPTLIGQILAVFLFYDRHWYNVSFYNSSIISNEILSLLEQRQKNELPDKNSGSYLNLLYEFRKSAKLPTKQSKISEELEIFKNILDVKINKKNIVRLNKDGKIEVLFQAQDGLFIITFSSKVLISPTVYIFVLWLVFLTIMLLSISLIFSKNQIKSILALAYAADSFGKGTSEIKQFRPSGAKEVKKAGFAFLKMQERIEKQIAKRTTMLAMISHDLRTPLTRMKLQLALMEDSEAITGLTDDIKIMQQMITSYLDFAKGESSEESSIVLIYPWFLNIINKWPNIDIKLIAPGYPERMRRISLKALRFKGEPAENLQDDNSAQDDLDTKMQDLQVPLKPHAFERAIANIISNSIKYATKITIAIYSDDSNIIIEIEDNGTGIRDEEKPLVFKPFYRSDKSRIIDNSSHVGLGLAICKEIIADHNGTITLLDGKKLGGLLVKIALPVHTK